MRTKARMVVILSVVTSVALLCGDGPVGAKDKKDKNKDPYAEYVWPPPPDDPRIKLEAVITGRADVVTKSGFKRKILKQSAQSQFDRLRKPIAVEFDPEGRILVTDWTSAALLRFDLEGRRMDVFGKTGSVRLKQPMGLDVASDGRIFVADTGLAAVVSYDAEGELVAVYGSGGKLSNPTDSALSPDGTKLFVADSKEHRIVVFDVETGDQLFAFGSRGEGPGEFAWPTSLTFDAEGLLYVVDQINCRVQVFAADGEFEDEFGTRGAGFGQFTRPKDVAVDEVGIIYVTDNAFNNVQLFDNDFSLLTFIGVGGAGPGEFFGASGIAVQGDRIAVVDQIGTRLQVFRFIADKTD